MTSLSHDAINLTNSSLSFDELSCCQWLVQNLSMDSSKYVYNLSLYNVKFLLTCLMRVKLHERNTRVMSWCYTNITIFVQDG